MTHRFCGADAHEVVPSSKRRRPSCRAVFLRLVVRHRRLVVGGGWGLMILGLGECLGGVAQVELQQLVHAVGPRLSPGARKLELLRPRDCRSGSRYRLHVSLCE